MPKNDMMELAVRADRLVQQALSWLTDQGKYHGHWGEVRSTALAAMCLSRRVPNSPWIPALRNWILDQQKDLQEENIASWGEEIWDTAMALIALSDLGIRKCPEIEKAFNFLIKLYNLSGRNNWHDEPWETSWAILAFCKYPHLFHLLPSETEAFDPKAAVYNACLWLSSLQDKEDGKIVAPHYTGYFLLITNGVHNYLARHFSHENLQILRQSATRASEYLIGFWQSSERAFRERLWTGEPWSNGQITWALAESGNLLSADIGLSQAIVDWFSDTPRNRSEQGNWKDVEDTCSSVLGLDALIAALQPEVWTRTRNCQYLAPPTSKLWQRDHDRWIFVITARHRKFAAIALGVITTLLTLQQFLEMLLAKLDTLFRNGK